MQPGVGTSDPGGQLGHSFHNGFAAVRGNVGINLRKVSFAGRQQHSKLLDTVGQERSIATGQHGLCFLVAPIRSVGHQGLALNSPVLPTVHASGYLPVPLNFDVSARRVIDELLGPLSDD